MSRSGPAPLHLFIVQHVDIGGGANGDLFVTARGPKDAAKIWQRYYETDASPEYVFRVPVVGVRRVAHQRDTFKNEA